MRCTRAGSIAAGREQRLGGEPVVAFGVLRRHAALVGEPDLHAVPVRRARRRAARRCARAWSRRRARGARRRAARARSAVRGRSPRRRARRWPRGRRRSVMRVIGRLIPLTAASSVRPAARAGRWGRAAAPGGCPRRGCPASPREAPRIVHSCSLPAPSRWYARRPPVPRSRRRCDAGGGLELSPARPRTCCSGAAWRRSAISCSPAWAAPLAASPPALPPARSGLSRQPSREASQPISSIAATVESGWWRTVIAEIARARSAAPVGRRSPRSARARGSSAATRGRRRRRWSESVLARSIASCQTGSSTESSSIACASGSSASHGLGVAVGRPQQRRQVGDDERVGDRQQVVEVAVAELDDHGLVQQHELARRLASPSEAIARARVQARAVGLVGEHDQARGVVAPDAAQAVGDLPAPLALDERDHVQHARGQEAAVFGVALGEQLAQRRFDRVRRRALLAPDGVADGRHRSDRAPVMAVEQQAVRLLGPLRAGLVLRQRPAVPASCAPTPAGSGRRSATAPRPRRCG